jgi:ribosomal protein L11 methyltransferase
MSNTLIEPGEQSQEALMADIDLGLLLRGGQWGYVWCEKGQYTCHAGEGVMIRNGQPAEQVRDVSISGMVLETLADADWLAMALSGLPPVRAGRFFVYGAHDRGRAPPNTINLRIEAGAAFGTGHHGTTVGCLLAYDQLLKSKRFKRVLDVGCGTGVLGIAAARTGSQVAVGTDIDRVSVRIARENARLNDADARFVHASGLGHRLVRDSGPYDLVFANILAPPLVFLSQPIKLALKPGGLAILSGLLRSQERRVTAAYLSKGFRVVRRLHRDAWATLVLQRC